MLTPTTVVPLRIRQDACSIASDYGLSCHLQEPVCCHRAGRATRWRRRHLHRLLDSDTCESVGTQPDGRGIGSPPTQGTAFKAGVRFLSFDSIKNQLKDHNGKLSPGKGILAGMIAGCVESVIAVTPTERIKTAL